MFFFKEGGSSKSMSPAPTHRARMMGSPKGLNVPPKRARCAPQKGLACPG